VYYSQIVREHVSTAFCRAQSGGHADAKILVGFEGLEPSRLAAPVSETGAYANFRQKPNFFLANFHAPGNKKPGALARQPGFVPARILLASGAVSPRCCRLPCIQLLPLVPRVIDARHPDVKACGAIRTMRRQYCGRTDP
jgi:hypothetical protein